MCHYVSESKNNLHPSGVLILMDFRFQLVMLQYLSCDIINHLTGIGQRSCEILLQEKLSVGCIGFCKAID